MERSWGRPPDTGTAASPAIPGEAITYGTRSNEICLELCVCRMHHDCRSEYRYCITGQPFCRRRRPAIQACHSAQRKSFVQKCAECDHVAQSCRVILS